MVDKSLFQLYIARLREFRREPSAFFFVLLVPVLWMLVLGFALNPKDTHDFKFKVGLVANEMGQKRDLLQESLMNHRQITLIQGSLHELRLQLRRGEVSVIVEDQTAQNPQKVIYFHDQNQRESREAVLWVDREIQQIFGQKDAIETEMVGVSGPGSVGSRYVDFLIPGLLSVSILSTSIFGIGMTIVSHRKEGLLKQLFVTPVRPSFYILSHVLGRITILAVEGGVLLFAARVIFGFRIHGSLGLFVSLAILGSAMTTAMATLLGARLSHTGAMNGLSNLLMLPLMLLSGAWFSRHHFPTWLYHVSEYLPLTPLVEGLRRVAIDGATLIDVKVHIGIMLIYFVIATVLSAKFFTWYEAK